MLCRKTKVTFILTLRKLIENLYYSMFIFSKDFIFLNTVWGIHYFRLMKFWEPTLHISTKYGIIFTKIRWFWIFERGVWTSFSFLSKFKTKFNIATYLWHKIPSKEMHFLESSIVFRHIDGHSDKHKDRLIDAVLYLYRYKVWVIETEGFI